MINSNDNSESKNLLYKIEVVIENYESKRIIFQRKEHDIEYLDYAIDTI